MPGSGPALLGMPDIDALGLLKLNCEIIGRHLVSGDNANNSYRNCQYERAVDTAGGMPESCTHKRQDADTQSQHNAESTA